MDDGFSSIAIRVGDFAFSTVVTALMGSVCAVPVLLIVEIIQAGKGVLGGPADTWRSAMSGCAMFGDGLWVYYMRKRDKLERRLSESYRKRKQIQDQTLSRLRVHTTIASALRWDGSAMLSH